MQPNTIKAYCGVPRSVVKERFENVEMLGNFIEGEFRQSTADLWYPVHDPVLLLKVVLNTYDTRH